MLIWIKFLRLVFMSNLRLAFENSLFFKLSRSMFNLITDNFKPYKHERLSLLIGKPVLVDNPYFSGLSFKKSVKWWYKNKLIERI